MGYSQPKKQFDLKEFLSQPATKLPTRRFGLRTPPSKPVSDDGANPASPVKSET